MPWAEGQPDPNVLRQLYGPAPSNDPYDLVLASLHARRKYLSLLIQMLELEFAPVPKANEPPDQTNRAAR